MCRKWGRRRCDRIHHVQNQLKYENKTFLIHSVWKCQNWKIQMRHFGWFSNNMYHSSYPKIVGNMTWSRIKGHKWLMNLDYHVCFSAQHFRIWVLTLSLILLILAARKMSVALWLTFFLFPEKLIQFSVQSVCESHSRFFTLTKVFIFVVPLLLPKMSQQSIAFPFVTGGWWHVIQNFIWPNEDFYVAQKQKQP